MFIFWCIKRLQNIYKWQNLLEIQALEKDIAEAFAGYIRSSDTQDVPPQQKYDGFEITF